MLLAIMPKRTWLVQCCNAVGLYLTQVSALTPEAMSQAEVARYRVMSLPSQQAAPLYATSRPLWCMERSHHVA